MARTQKALVIPERFAPYTLVSDHPVPKPKKDELLVKIKAVALNPADWKFQKFGVVFEEFPAVAGFDIAGEVVEVGEEAEVKGKFAVGDRVFFGSELTTMQYGGFQEFTIADATTAAKIPAHLSDDEVVTLPAGICTAYVGMYDAIPRGLGLEPLITNRGKHIGQAIFISGGSSSMGQVAIQFARLSGFTHIIASASLKNTDFLKGIGATHIIDRSLATSPTNIRAALNEIPDLPVIDYAYDAIGDFETSLMAALNAVGPKGVIVTVGHGLDLPKVLEEEQHKEKTVCTFTARKRVGNNPAIMKALWGGGFLEELLEKGDLKPQRYQVLPRGLAGIPEGLRKLEEGSISGLKLVVHPEETN